MDFGFIGNGAAMHDLPALARHVQDAYDELKQAAAHKRPARRGAARARPNT
jgi:hypothetical protein